MIFGYCSMSIGPNSVGTSPKEFILNSALVKGTSGDCVCVHFSPREDQSNGTLDLHFWCNAQSGTPNLRVSLLATSSSVYGPDTAATYDVLDGQTATPGSDQAAATAEWLSFSFTGVYLTANKSYWALLHNVDATPATNTATIYPYSMSQQGASGGAGRRCSAETSINGATGLTGQGISSAYSSRAFCGVVKFNNGAIHGSPMVGAYSPTSGTEHIGARFTPDRDYILLSWQQSEAVTATNLDGYLVCQGTTIIQQSSGSDATDKDETSAAMPLTLLKAGLPYDFFYTWAAAHPWGLPKAYRRNDGVASIPADVSAISWGGLQVAHAPATYPASGSVTVLGEGQLTSMFFTVYEAPTRAIKLIGHRGLVG